MLQHTVFETMSAACSSPQDLLDVSGAMPLVSSLAEAVALAVSFKFAPENLSSTLAVFRGLLESSLWLVLSPEVGEQPTVSCFCSLGT